VAKYFAFQPAELMALDWDEIAFWLAAANDLEAHFQKD
jgi:hypothetical protein